MKEVAEIPESEEMKEEIKRRKEVAKDHWKALIKAQSMSNNSSMQIGYRAYRLKKEDLFGVLGYANEHEARVAAGVGESTWYANIRLAEAFEGVSEERFVAMKQANARSLADLPESMRTSTEWLRMAETEKIEAFAEKCAAEMGDKAKPSDGKEATSALRLVMPVSRKAVIDSGIKDFAQAHGVSLDDPGKVIELMVLETTGGQTMLGSITTTLQRIGKMRDYLHSGVSADEAIGKFEECLNEMVLDLQAALEQASQRQAA